MKKIYSLFLLLALFTLASAPVSAVKWSSYKVSIDPGHGGTDPGASGPSAPHEAELALRASLQMRTQLQGVGCNVTMTRTTNATLSLTARRSHFLAQDPWIACSVHLNAFNKTAHGTETWYYWSTGNSYPLAVKVQNRLVQQLGRANRGVKQNGWTVITASASIPSVLTEGLFVDNATEWGMINTTAKQGFKNWVNGHVLGFWDHLKTFNSALDNPTSTAPVKTPTISPSSTSLAFGNVVSGQTKALTFTVSTKDLSGNISVSSNSGAFTVSPTSLGTGGGTVTVTFKPTAAQSYSGTITLSSSGASSKTVSVSGAGQARVVSVSPSNLAFGNVNKGATKNMSFTVSGSNLNNNVTVSSNSSAFTVSPTSLGTGGGTVTVTFKPTAVQNYTGTITLASSGASGATVSLTGAGTVPPLNLTEKFNISQTKGNTTTKGWNSTLVRNMAYGSGKLYMVYEHAGIKVVKAQSGDFLYDLNKSGVSGGALTLCDVGFFDGKAIACNLGTDTSPLKVYVWDNDFSAPRLILETSNLGGAKRLGDYIGFTGNLTNGKLTFANDDDTTTRIVNYAISNGTVSTTPTVVNATTNGTTRLACATSIRIQPDATGYWINGKDNPLTRLDTSGKMSYEVPQDNQHGNGFSAFVYDGVQYAVMSTFVGSTNYTGGAMELVEASKGWQSAEVVATYPSAGLGTTANTNCTGAAIGQAGSNYVETWVLSTGQGIAYYATGTTPTHTYTTKELSTSLSNLSFGNVTYGQTKAMTFNVSGTGLSGNISLSSNSAAYTVSPASLGASGGTVTVTFKPTAKQTYTGTITVTGDGVTKTVALTGSGVEDPAVAKEISVNPTSLNMACTYDKTATATFSVTSTNLSANIAVGSNSSAFTVSPTSLPATGGTVTVTFRPSAQTTYNGTITLSSTGADNKTVAVTGVGQALGEISFTEVWNHSQTKNTVSAEGWDADNVRNMAYNDDKLYLVYGTNLIKVINAKNGKPIRDMNMTDVAGGWPAISDVGYFDGKVVACNIPNASAPDFKVYVWDSETGAPRVALTTQNFGGSTRIGDKMGFYGTWSNGTLTLAATTGGVTRILNYKITNGTIATTPTVVNATKADGTALIYTSSVGVVPDATGYYINGKGGFLTRLDANGKAQYELTQSNNHAVGFTVFSYYGSNYVMANTFVSPTNYQGGAMEWYDVGNDWAAATLKETMPEGGLGTGTNTNGTGAALVVTGNGFIDAWVLSTTQGIAYYKYGSEGQTTNNPTLDISQTSLAFGNVDKGQTKAMSFTVDALDISGNLTVSSNNSSFTVNPASLSSNGGTVTVTFSPAAVQSYSGTITVSGGGLSKTVSVSGAGVDSAPVVKTITVSQESLSLSCPVDQTKTASFTVTGDNLTGDISISSNVSNFTVAPKTLGKTGGVVTVTFDPSEVKTYNGTITLSSSGATNKTVAVTGTATTLGAITFTEGWNQSVAKGNATANSWDATKIRNMAYGNNGKLYYVHDQAEVRVLESQTGKYVGTMDKTGVSGGTLTLCDVAYFDGKVVACNLRVGNATPFTIYVWDGESSKPRKILETTNFGGLTRIGETIGLHGTWSDGKVSFGETASGVTRIANYKITNGVISPTPTTIEVTADGNPLVYTSTVRVIPDADGYYINGKGGYLTRLNASGVKQYDLVQTNKLANGGMPFNYYGNKYVVASTFLEGNYDNGAMQVFNVGNDWTNASLVGTYPSAGLGVGNNSAGTGHAIAAVSDSSIELWVLSTLQGIAYYKYGSTPNFGSISLETGNGMVSDDAALARVYVSNNTLYIKGVDAGKVELYALSGTRVLSVENQNTIDLPSIGNGVYVVVLTTADGNVMREKVIIR